MLLTIYLQFKSTVWFPKRAKSRRAGIRLQEDCQEDCIESRVSATGCPIPGKPYSPPREIFWASAAPAEIHAGAHAKIPVAAPYRNAAQPMRRKNAVRRACPKRPPEACTASGHARRNVRPQHSAQDMQRNRARRTRRKPVYGNARQTRTERNNARPAARPAPRAQNAAQSRDTPAAPAGIHAGAHAKIPVAAPYRNAAQPSAAKTPSAARARNARRTPARHGTRPPKRPPATQRAGHAAESCILRRSTAQDCRAV